MNKFQDRTLLWLRQHALVIAFTLLVGTLSVLPHILAVHALGETYKGIPFLYLNNEDYYLARIHEIADGHYLVGSPYFFEYKNIIQVVPPVGEYLYILLSIVTGASLPNTLVLAKFLFPALLFVLVYLLTKALTKKGGSENEVRWGAIAAALMVTLGAGLADYYLLFLRLTGKEGSEILSMWTRPVNPITGALFLFTFLNLLWCGMQKTSWTYFIAAGAILGLSIGYIFSFALGFSMLGVLFLFALFTKEYPLVKKFTLTGITGLAVPMLYWINVIPQLGNGSSLAERNGLMLMHTPLPNKALLASCILFGLLFFFGYRKAHINLLKEHQKNLPLWFAMALLLAGLIALNQQLLTGRTVWPFHFVQYTIPLAMVALFVGIFFLLRPVAANIWKAIIGVSIGICLIFSLWNSTTYPHALGDFSKLQDLAPIFSWLNSTADKDCVVLVSEDSRQLLNGFLPGFTYCNVYTSNYLTGSAIPGERIRHNFFVQLRIHGVNADTINQYLEKHQDDLVTYFYKDWFELFNLKKTDRIHSVVTPEIENAYKEFLKQDFEKELAMYRINFIIARDPLLPITKESLPHWHEAAQFASTTIYSFHE